LSLIDFSQANTRRSLLLLATGTLIGLAIAGYGLFTAAGTATHTIPPEAIATVNGRLILRTDFVTQVQTQFGITFKESTHEQRERVLQDMIDEELMVQRGLEADLASYDPEVRQALVNGVELQIFADVLAQQPTDAELKDYYDKHRDRYVRDGIMMVRDLVVPLEGSRTPGQAEQIAHDAIAAFRKNKTIDHAAVDAMLPKFGLADSRKLLDSGHIDTGNIFDFSAKARLDPSVFAAAAKLAPGEVSEPVVASDGGVHLVVMIERAPPLQRQYADVGNEVWADLKKDAQQQVRNANLKYLQSKATVLSAGAQ
jgi:parvulin-like peptidyl-prolyl cis-trans isomerase-like protein/SurA-like protein